MTSPSKGDPNTNIEIMGIDFALPHVYHSKPYRMRIRVPVHNYKASKPKSEVYTDPPFVELSKEDMEHMFKQLGNLLGYETEMLKLIQVYQDTITKSIQSAMHKSKLLTPNGKFRKITRKQIIEDPKALENIRKELFPDGT